METSIVQVISKEILKPSSQTPNHLKLSVLDRLQSPLYVTLLFFYQANDSTGLTSNVADRAQISDKLKRSLSDTLTTFYPLAGKLDPKTFIVHCDDVGVTYVEARVHSRLSDTIQDPRTEQLKQLCPISTANSAGNVLLAVQTNFFDCGGIAIGLCVSHQVADAISAIAFVNSWTATYQGKVPISSPSFDLADHFPDRDMSGSKISVSNISAPEEVFVTKRFVFDKEKLVALRAAATSTESPDVVKHPSRVELVSAFIWKMFTQAAISNELYKQSDKPYTCTAAEQVVNLRSRVDLPHSLDDVFGNCFVNQVQVFNHDHGSPEIHGLVREFRNQIRVVNDDYIRKTQSGNDHEGYLSDFEKAFDLLSREETAFCGFSSWCRFPLYEVDYGWGKPVWVGTTGLAMLNFTILMDDKSGDGVEASIHTLPHNIEFIESNFKLL